MLLLEAASFVGGSNGFIHCSRHRSSLKAASVVRGGIGRQRRRHWPLEKAAT